MPTIINNVDSSASPAAGGEEEYIKIVDQKTLGTEGGTFTTGADRTRDLNTIVNNEGTSASLAANVITLTAGTYRFFISCPALRVEFHQAKLVNTTDTIEFLGSSERSENTERNITRSFVCGKFTIAASKDFEVRHACAITEATSGFGEAGNLNAEIYTIAEFFKEV